MPKYSPMIRKSCTSLIALWAAVTLLPVTTHAQSQEEEHDHASETHGRNYIEEIIVTATLSDRSQFDIAQSTDVLSGGRLNEEMSGNLGETLDHVPGIANSYFGPGAGRPIIRGLGGDRIRVLIGGIGSIDASSTSPDHAVAGDPLTAQSIEIIRGPATLLYGNNALGGVINMLDGRIPFAPGDKNVEGAARGMFGTNANEKSFAAATDITPHDQASFHVEGSRRLADDITIPGFLRSEALRLADPLHADEGEEEEFGSAPNSSLESSSFSAGGTWFFDQGFLGAAVGFNGSNYGIPAGHAHHEEEGVDHEEEEHDEEGVRIDLSQIRFDMMGEIRTDFLAFDTAKIRLGVGDYEHKELEDGNIGTTFLNDGWEGRIELRQKEMGNRDGAVGIQFRQRNFKAIGDEAFVPPSTTRQFGLFGLQEWQWDTWSGQLGARLEIQDTSAPTMGKNRSFTGFSVSGGISRYLGDDVLFGITAHSTERAPNAEELFSNGPHLATSVFEVGNIDLQEERALGGEVTLRKKEGPLSGGATFYMNKFSNFIFEEFTGAENDHLPVAMFEQADAFFYGGEFEAELEAWHAHSFEVFIDAALDFVIAEQTSNDTPLPRIPPRTFKLGTRLVSEKLDVRLEGEWASAQDRISAIETTTDGYFKLDTSVTYRPWGDKKDVSLVLQVRNLTDEEIRYHASFLKDQIPAPGRDVRLSLRAGF